MFKMGKYRQIFACALLALALLAAGCDSGQGKGQSSSSSAVATQTQQKQEAATAKEDKTVKEEKLTVKVYYPNEQGTKLIAVKRKIKTDAKTDKYTAALQSLLSGTKEKGQATIIPKQAKLRSVKVADGVAKVDFSQDLVKHFVGGSTGEDMLVGSVVNTLTEFSEVKQVQILIEGKQVETLAGHLDLSEPLSRMQELL